MNIDQKRYKTKGEFVVKEIDNEFILVPLKNNVADMNLVYNLNEIGYFIWQRLDGKKTVADIVADILSEFDVDHTSAQNDAINFLNNINEIIQEVN